MIRLSIRPDVKDLLRDVDELKRKQIPYIVAQTVNGAAKRAAAAEGLAMSRQLDRPRPFTLRSIGIRYARKEATTAIIFIKDVQARYLTPEILGGKQVLLGTSRAILKPIAQPLNQYGNLPRGLLQRLKGRSDIFIGSVTFKKSGQTISGVWQRGQVSERRRGGSGTKGRNVQAGLAAKTVLKLLIHFADPVDVKTRYGWGHAAAGAVNSTTTAAEFNRAWDRALATAR